MFQKKLKMGYEVFFKVRISSKEGGDRYVTAVNFQRDHFGTEME
jgi:hypothetical protein